MREGFRIFMKSDSFRRAQALSASLILMLSLTFVSVSAVGESGTYEQWGPRVNYAQLIIYGTYEEEVAALRAGHIDIMDWPLDYESYDSMKDDPTFVVEPLTMYDCYDIDINCLRWPTSDYRFRKAIAHLINYEAFYTNILRAYAGEMMDNIIWWEWTKWYNSLAPKYWFDIGLATSILGEAGYQNWDADTWLEWKAPNGTIYELPDLEFYARQDDPLRNALGDMLNAELLAMGIPTRYVVASRSVCWNHAYKTPYDYHLYTAGMGPFVDPQFLYDYYHSKYATPDIDWVMNNVFFINATYDYWVEKLKFATDDATAIEAAKKAQEIFMDQVPLIPVYHSAGAMAYRAKYGHHSGEEPYWEKPWKGVVNSVIPTTTSGINDWWTLLNAHPGDVERGGVLRYGMMDDVDHVNPVTVYSYWDSILLDELYSTLIMRDPYSGDRIPWLAREWKVETWDYGGKDATKLTIKLRENLKWSNGMPLNSTDVAFTMKYMYDANSATYYPFVEAIDGIDTTNPHIETPDPYTVVIYYTVQSIWVLEWAGDTPIIPKHVWATIDPKFCENKGEFIKTGNLTGSGPYVIAGYKRGEWWLLRANPYFFRFSQVQHNVAVNSVTPSVSEASIGQTVDINVEVANLGTEAETFDVTTYANESIIGMQTVSLGSGQKTTLVFSWNTAGMGKGNYVIKAMAGPVSGETYTADNTLVDGTVRLIPLHDIAVTSVSAFPPSVLNGENVTITVTVENVGMSTETFDVTAFYDSTSIGTQTVASLARDESRGLTFDWETTGVANDTYTIKARAGPVPGETYIDDNEYVDDRVIVNPLVLHNIAVLSVDASPATVVAGSNVTIRALVRNLGSSTETFDVAAFYDSTLIETKLVSNLPPLAPTTLNFNWSTVGVTAGNFRINVTAGPVLGETLINDNWRQSGVVTVQAIVHDIAIIDVSASPSTVNVGENVTIIVKVKNVGTVAETFSVAAYYDDNSIETETITNLASGDTLTHTFTWSTAGVAAGNYTIKAIADLPNDINTADNTRVYGKVTVKIPPPTHDIEVISVSATPTTVNIGNNVTITVVVKNNGIVTETFSITVYGNQTPVATPSEVILTSNEERTITFTWNTAGVEEGRYVIKATASSVPEEADTTNNTYIDGTVTVMQPAPSGLQPESLGIIIAAIVAVAAVSTAYLYRKRRKPPSGPSS